MEKKQIQFDIRNCLECGKGLKGRLGKKYCDHACKSAYHNRYKSEGEVVILKNNRIIRQNRSILKILSPEGKATVRKEVLDHMGYDYRYFSSIFKSNANLYYLAYDYAFSPIFEKGVEKALIVQRQDYMDRLGFELWKRESS